MVRVLPALALAIAIASSAARASIITILPLGPNNLTSNFGVDDTVFNTAHGQIIRVPVGDNRLVSFTFSLVDVVDSFDLQGEVYRWTGDPMNVGAPLYVSDLKFVTGAGDYVFTPGIAVDSGADYLFALRAVAHAGIVAGSATILSHTYGHLDPDSDPYPDAGTFPYGGAKTYASLSGWAPTRNTHLAGRFEFAASPSAVPEPGTLAIWLLLGGSGVAASFRRRRKAC